MKKIREFFDIHSLGWLELIIALYPIMASYNYGKFLMYLAIPLILSLFLIVTNPPKNNGYGIDAFKYFIIYLFAHFLLWIPIIGNPPSYYYNQNIQFFIIILTLVIILPYLNLKKLVSSINLVGLICACGMVYQSVEILMGRTVSTIPLPFLPSPDETSRIFTIIENRPVSFFTEPQTYVSYMIVPLFLALSKKNLILALIISVTILLSGSTTGIAMIAIMFVAYILTSKVGKFYRILLVAVLIGLGYFLLSSELTTAGADKMNDTNLSENVRVINGFLVAKALSISDFIFGITFANATDFCYANGINGRVILDGNGNVFISGFWIALIRYGIIGLLLYLNLYLRVIKSDKTIFPYWLCIVIALFTNPDFLGANFLFILLFSYTYVKQRNIKNNEEDININNAIR